MIRGLLSADLFMDSARSNPPFRGICSVIVSESVACLILDELIGCIDLGTSMGGGIGISAVLRFGPIRIEDKRAASACLHNPIYKRMVFRERVAFIF